MITHRLPVVAGSVAVLACITVVAGRAQNPPTTSDPLARVLAESSSTLAAETSTDQLWTDAKAGIETSLRDAERALGAGRRWFALERLAQARQSLLATQRWPSLHGAQLPPPQSKSDSQPCRYWSSHDAVSV